MTATALRTTAFARAGVAVLMLAGLALLALPATSSPVKAETPVRLAQSDPVGSFFRRLLGIPDSPRVRRPPQPQRAIPDTPAQPAAPARLAKDPDARVVLVIGDSLASNLSDGLDEAFAESPGIRLTTLTKAESGLVRDDFYDWPRTVTSLLEAGNPINAAVVMIGVNDRQELTDSSGPQAFRSERWAELYAARVDELILILLGRGIPVVWVGLPPMQDGELSQGAARLNAIYRERVERVNAPFVDVWNSFLGEDGAYSSHGPDLSGQRRRLRGRDGIHMTQAGARKLAYFAEREVRRLLDLTPEGFLAEDGQAGFDLATPQIELETGIGRIVSLTGAPPRPGLELAGGPDTPRPLVEVGSFARIMQEGEPPAPAEERADAFRWDAAETPPL